MILRVCLALALVALALAETATATRAPERIRVGGPSAPAESKVAILGSDRSHAGDRYAVVDAAGHVVLRGKLKAAPGRPDPWEHAYLADLSAVDQPGSYRVRAGKLTSRRWKVADRGSRPAIGAILRFFEANRDGNEPSPVHAPAHLHDAVIHPAAPSQGGERIEITGGWMDAGDTLHFTQTTAFAAAVLQAAASLDPADAAALQAEADVGVRWLAKTHPFPDVFIAQVGDERDHNRDFSDPAKDDASSKPGIGTRFAYSGVGGDLGGKAATALAQAFRRTGDSALLTLAKEWYDAGVAANRALAPLRRAGYPKYAANFYVGSRWKDSLAAGAVELYRATCAAGACDDSYLTDFVSFISSGQAAAEGDLGVVDSFGSFAAADACGAFGDARLPGDAGERGCDLLRENGAIAVRRAHSNAFGMPGFFTWGTTATNGGSGALAALATATPQGLAGGCKVAAGARDYLLGRNPFGRGFVVGYGRRSPRHPHGWGSVFGPGVPSGAVVGGPAPRSAVDGQGFEAPGPFNTRFATYEDRLDDYVTSEPAIDYAADSVLLLAALAAHCG